MVDEKPWSEYSESDYSIEQWHAACLIHQHEGAPTSKGQCKLPVKTPSGAVNRNGVHAAAAALSGARGGLNASEDEKAAASKALARLYSQLDETPPVALLRHFDDDDIRELFHYGVPGMRWGHRKNDSSAAEKPAKSEDAAKAEAFKSQARKHGVSTLNNEQLQELNRRLELESKYNQWLEKNPSLKTKATKFVAELLIEEGKTQLGMGKTDKNGKQEKSDLSKIGDVLKQAFGQGKGKKRPKAEERSQPKDRSNKKKKTSRRTPTPVYKITSL